MARPKNTDRKEQPLKPPMDETEISEERQMKDFDLYMVRVKRYMNDDNGLPDTESVEVGKFIRKVKTSTLSANALNATQDWRNDVQEGQPVIQWFFPAEHEVKAGMTFKAHDTFKKSMGKSVATGLVIDSSKAI